MCSSICPGAEVKISSGAGIQKIIGMGSWRPEERPGSDRNNTCKITGAEVRIIILLVLMQEVGREKEREKERQWEEDREREPNEQGPGTGFSPRFQQLTLPKWRE